MPSGKQNHALSFLEPTYTLCGLPVKGQREVAAHAQTGQHREDKPITCQRCKRRLRRVRR